MSLHCLKEICALVQHHVHHILHNLYPIEYLPLLWIKKSVTFAISSSGNICGIMLGTEEILNVSYEWFSLGYSASGVSSAWLCGSSLLIKFSLNWEKAWSIKPSYGSNFILFLFITPWTPCCCSLLWYNGGEPDSNFFHLWTEKTKASHDEQIFLEIKVYLSHDIERSVLFFDSKLFFLKSSI